MVEELLEGHLAGAGKSIEEESILEMVPKWRFPQILVKFNTLGKKNLLFYNCKSNISLLVCGK